MNARQTTCHVRRYVLTNTRAEFCRLDIVKLKALYLSSVKIILNKQINSRRIELVRNKKILPLVAL